MKKLISIITMCVCLGFMSISVSASQQTVNGTGPDETGDASADVPTTGKVGEYDEGDPENPEIPEVSNLSMSIPKEMKFYIVTNTKSGVPEITTPHYYFKNNGKVKVNGYLKTIVKKNMDNVVKLVDSIDVSNGTASILPVAIQLQITNGAGNTNIVDDIIIKEEGFMQAPIGLFNLSEEKILDFKLHGAGVNKKDLDKLDKFSGPKPREVSGEWIFTYYFSKAD